MLPKFECDSMVYIEIKTIHGKKYKYLRKSIRDGDKVRHITIKCLGPVDPIYKTGRTRKTNASIYVGSLQPGEIKDLKKATRSSDAFTRDRAKIFLLSSKGYTVKEIAGRIGCEVRKVRKAVKAFNKIGLKALERGKAKGAKPRFTKEQRAEILQVVSTDPRTLGLPYTTWSLRKLKKYIINQNIVDYISIYTIREILRSERMKIKKSKRFQYSNDPDFAKKNYG